MISVMVNYTSNEPNNNETKHKSGACEEKTVCMIRKCNRREGRQK